MTTHTGKKPFVCEHEGCTQSFMISAKLRKHQRVHSVEPRYRCGYTGCTSDFTRWSQLQQHIRDAHPTKCPRCGKALKTRDGLSKHLKTHIDGRQTFPCYFPECEKIFASVKSLNVHIRSRHEGLRPFKCEFEECNSAFAHKHLLVRHRRIHEEPKTPKAKKTTPDLPKATALTEIEVLTGTNYAGAGTRRHIRCAFEDCPFVFARRQDLERHLKSFVHDEDIEELVGAEPQLEEVGNETQLGGKLTGGEWAKGATVVSVGGGQRMALKRRIQSTEKVLAELDAQFGDAEGRKGLLLALGINDK
ncbi:hypothetical protein BC938DRAFT_470594 [Jimgerdemannia flammicorona]|uniref:C2H2-type domain-containing protein n=1 Tax=Jimgerdemannia flammicorona TaxID=994334 RepID=A0A433Q9V4_9FUNG|nr:hypothetical protein BC938DRAFT_470594 [Jimgerdemannia flammicorona]